MFVISSVHKYACITIELHIFVHYFTKVSGLFHQVCLVCSVCSSPPPFYYGRRRDFDLSLENAWYGRVSLLFSMKFRTDSGEVRDVDCAMIDVFFNYAEGRCFVCTLVHSHIRKLAIVHRLKQFGVK